MAPVHLLLPLLTARIVGFVRRLRILGLLLVPLVVEVFLEVALFSLIVELLEGRSEEFRCQSEQILIDFFFLTAGILLSVAIEGCLGGWLSRFFWSSIGVSTVLHLLLLLFFHPLLLLFEALLMLVLVLVHHIDKELNIGHVLDSK